MVTVGIAVHDHDGHPAHLCGGWVRAVGRCRDQADIAMRIATAVMISADREQARILACAPEFDCMEIAS